MRRLLIMQLPHKRTGSRSRLTFEFDPHLTIVYEKDQLLVCGLL